MIETLTRWLWPFPARRVVAGTMLALGLGRLGVYIHAAETYITDDVYGWAMLVVAGALLLTEHRHALRWYGRVITALAAGLMAGLGADLWLSTGHLSTSIVILFWLAIVLFIETGAIHDC